MGLYFIHHININKPFKILIRNHTRHNILKTEVCWLAYYTFEAQWVVCYGVSAFRCRKSGSSQSLTVSSDSTFSLRWVHIQTRGPLVMTPGPQVG